MSVTFYVKTNGNDAADGLTYGTAVKTIARACALWNGLSAANQGGSYVLVDNGTYIESQVYIQPVVNSSGLFQLIPLHPAWPPNVKILGTTLSEGAIYVWSAGNAGNTNSPYAGVIINNFEVSDGTAGGTLQIGISVATPNTTVTQCYVHDTGNNNPANSGGDGIEQTGYGDGANPTGIVISRNLIIHCGPTAGGNQNHGIYANGYGTEVVNNIVGNIPGGFGIHSFHLTSYLFFHNNTVFNCALGGLIVSAGTQNSVHNRMYNNISYGSPGYGWRSFQTNPFTIDYTDASSNIGFNNTSGDFIFADATTFNNFDAIHADPLFVNYQANGSGDYHIQAASPANDGGTGVGSPTIDFSGTLRPLGYNYDIGAYEFIPGYATLIVQDSSGNIIMALGPQGTGQSQIEAQSQYVGANDSVEAAIAQSRPWFGNVDPLTRGASPGPQDGDLWFNDSPASTSQNQTVGDQNTPGSYANWYAGPNNQKWVQWPCNITGTIVSISLYDDGVGSTASATWGCVWTTGGTLLGNTSKGLFSGGSKTIKGQHWHTLSGISVAVTSGTTYRIGWQNDGNLNAWSCYSDNEAPFTGFGYASGSTSGPSNLGSASTPVENKPMGVYFVVQTSATTQVHIALLRNGAWVTIVT